MHLEKMIAIGMYELIETSPAFADFAFESFLEVYIFLNERINRNQYI